MGAAEATWPAEARRRTRGSWRRTGALSRGVLVFVTVAIQGLLGCNGASPGATQSAGSETPAPRPAASCESLSVEQCAVSAWWPSEARCKEVIGTPFDAASQCHGRVSAVACRDATRFGCDATLVHATDPTGRVWQLPDTCTPGGWTVIHPQDGQYVNWPPCAGSEDPPELDCGTLTVDRCGTDGASSRCHVITGAAWDDSRECLGEITVVACGAGGAGAAFTCARDPSGVTWIFPDTRNPKGWTAVRCPPYAHRLTACSALSSGGI